MSKQIFREKSINKLSSPEQLNEYIRVASPSIWIILGATIIVLIGVVVCGTFGEIDTTISAVGTSINGDFICYVNDKDVLSIQEGMPIKINDNTYQVIEVATNPVEINEEYDTYFLHLGELSLGDWVYPISTDAKIAEGAYEVDIVIETISPISFITN